MGTVNQQASGMVSPPLRENFSPSVSVLYALMTAPLVPFQIPSWSQLNKLNTATWEETFVVRLNSSVAIGFYLLLGSFSWPSNEIVNVCKYLQDERIFILSRNINRKQWITVLFFEISFAYENRLMRGCLRNNDQSIRYKIKSCDYIIICSISGIILLRKHDAKKSISRHKYSYLYIYIFMMFLPYNISPLNFANYKYYLARNLNIIYGIKLGKTHYLCAITFALYF